MRRALIILAIVTVSGCADRPQVLDVGDGQDVVSLPSGGALLIRRAAQPETCYARARSFRGLVPISCDLAQMVRP